jgi:hypothetical protein
VRGASTVLMAKDFTAILWLYYHDKTIEGARATAVKEDLVRSPQLWRREGQSISRQRLRLQTVFDCL